MNTINISHKHHSNKENACEKAETFLEDLAEKYNLNIESDGDGSIDFSGSSISGKVLICEQEINLMAELGFLMTAMKPIISAEISNKLKESFS